MNSLQRPYVNGENIDHLKGETVTILGIVSNMNPNNSTFNIKSTDDKNVQVILPQPTNEHLNGLIEIHGESKGNSTIYSHNIITFPPEYSANFDFASHNELIRLLNAVPNLLDVR